MANIFKQNKEVNEHPKRNNFDLSFQNHLTMKFGTLYPVFCKEVVPGDSFRIESAFGLKFMPLVFPVQSGMRATMHFFYVRNKNIWKNWENFISNLEEHVHPYIYKSSSFYKTGSLADYLDIPTTIISSTEQFVSLNPELGNIGGSQGTSTSLNTVVYENLSGFVGSVDNLLFTKTPFRNIMGNLNNSPLYKLFPSLHPLVAPFASALEAPSSVFKVYGKLPATTIDVAFLSGSDDINSCTFVHNGFFTLRITADSTDGGYFLTASDSTTLDGIRDVVNPLLALGKKVFPVFGVPRSDTNYNAFQVGVNANLSKDDYFIRSFILENADVTLPQDVSESAVPYSEEIHLNALPFRAYQSIYNCYYRNWQNQPYLINGEPVFNRYNDTLEDGADETDYHLYQRNYELDYLTSAMPSPQQGNAPLVGMSALGTITIEDEDGITTAKAQLADDGHTIVGVDVTSPIAGRAHALTLAEIASAGMSINDFRNTNALTRWLEVNMRKGYRYMDFISGHFGKSPKYNELDLPEFIGGYSRDVQVNTILNQTASPSSDPLGSFAGVANCFGGSKHSITHYCDDYGWIIGILCVVPTPAYSQLLPKHYLKNSPLDYYFPEFSQLGMQPITYEEVCPTQAYSEYLADNTKKLQDTFGYQRPNYDLVSFTDQIHGEFRLSLRNFLINRIFGNRPVLGDDFLQINPDEVNDIFQVTTPENDVIAGQIVFRVHAKRPVPRIHLPSLGR